MTTDGPNPPMPDETRCPQCGAPIVAGALGGLCPACLLKQGAAQDTVPDAPGRGFEPPSATDLAPLFPQLEILELIGKGGMGAVYKARQKELDRIVALKILPRAMDDTPAFAERFAREAKALARLNHPGIVTIHEFGRADGLFYFLMEFVDGVNLRQLLTRGRVSPREALAIVPEICDALQCAHDLGIVHRDIKPENILLDRRGRVKIADFGLAKLVADGESGTAGSASASVDITLTEVGKSMGTPNYMAPEQSEHPGEVDHRADIYALGVVFYQMLTGELPQDRITPPSRKVVLDVRLDEVVLRALEKQPELRYQQASHVKSAVETIASTTPSASELNAEALRQEVLARDYTLNIGSCLRRGWGLVRNDFWPLVGITALITVLLGLAGSAGGAVDNAAAGARSSSATAVLFLLLKGPLVAGLQLYFLHKIRRRRASVETAFSGFSQRFLHLFLAGFVTTTLTAFGFFCLLLPGIYLMIAWTFTLALVIDKQLHFWTAMELSRKAVSKHWWKFFGFAIVLTLLKLMGLLASFIGFFIALPVAVAALMFAYEDIFSSGDEEVTQTASVAGAVGARGSAAKTLRTRTIVTVIVSFLAAVILAAAVFWPREYRAKVTMEVRPDAHLFSDQRSVDPNFIAVQQQILRKPEILRPVVERLELGKRHSKRGRAMPAQEAVARLARSVDVREIRNTGLIELAVYARDPELAANLANSIAVVYRDKRRQDSLKARDGSLAQLKDEVNEQRQQVERARAELDHLRERGGVIDSDPERTDAALTTSDGKGNVSAYAEAKRLHLQSRGILEAGEKKLSMVLLEQRPDPDPVHIWEAAEPPRARTPFSLRRLWNAVLH